MSWVTNLGDNSLGGILADEMGLGKTLQVIASTLLMKEEERPHLVIVRSILLKNWLREYKKFYLLPKF